MSKVYTIRLQICALKYLILWQRLRSYITNLLATNDIHLLYYIEMYQILYLIQIRSA